MTEAKLAHQEQAVLNGFVHTDGFGVGGHDFRNLGGSRHAPGRHHAVHNVAFGEDTHNLSVAQHRQRADAVFHHEARRFEHGAVGVDGIDPAIFHDIVNLPHT